MTTLLAVAGIEHTSEAFRLELCRLARRLGLDASAIAAVMSFETGGTFDPSKRNPRSSAVGLIQFTAERARQLGTSTAALAAMSALEQLAYVERHYQPIAPRVKTDADHYLAVFAPAGVGQGPDFVLFRDPGISYLANRELDSSHDGTITAGEAAAPMLRLLDAARSRPPFLIDEGTGQAAPALASGGGLAALFVAAIAWLVHTRSKHP